MRRLFVAAVFAIAACAPSLSMAAEADRADLIGKLCGDATSLGDGGRALTGIAADGSPDERAWAAVVARAVLDRKLSCDSKGAVVVSSEGSLDVFTHAQRTASEQSRSPLLSLKNRALFETAEAALALRTAPDVARRSAALRTLERQASSLPEHLFEAPAKQENDTDLKAQMTAVAQAAELNSADPAKRIVALARIAATPDQRALTLVPPPTRHPPLARHPESQRPAHAH